MRALAVIAAIVFTTTLAVAGTLSIEGAGGLSISITCDLPQVESISPEVAGEISIAPLCDEVRAAPMVLFVDGTARGLTSDSRGEFKLNADELGEGEHTMRLDSVDGEQLIASTGSVPFTVLGATRAAERQAMAPPSLGGERPAFIKLYKPRLYREIVYFNNREGDLEKHAFVRNGRVYITLTDLMRHIGGSIIWGPDDNDMMVYRNDVEVKVFPSSVTVIRNGVPVSLGVSTVRKQNRTYVPVRPFAALFDIVTEWDFQDDRAYVTYNE
ncbi:MAG: copper amine oxidase N-terminal domain-containing protein [candidate division WS1 bacterium]|nr:copper amine oxidase N-terminal domain-containing protein [candidate division WS1 bacterium]